MNPEMSPIPKPEPSAAGHYQTADDIDIVAATNGDGSTCDTDDWSYRPPQQSKSWLSKAVGVGVILSALAVGSWYAFPNLEKQHENWQYVAAATKASGAQSQVTHLERRAPCSVVSSIEVGTSDAARTATRKIRSALLSNDMITANALLQGAQNMPTASANPDAKPPELVAGSALVKELKNGKVEFYQIELFDCCYEDGDIIEVTVNGNSFATVPITNSGTMVSIPLARGNNTIGIRAVKDGGGGVTVSFRTSRGDYFAQSMVVGAEHQIGVVVQ